MATVALFLGGLFFLRKKKLARTVPVMWFGAGAGVNAFLLGLFSTGAGWIATTLGPWVGGAIVVLVGAAVWMSLQLGHDLWPRNKGAASRTTAVVALFLPMLATMIGDGWIPTLILTVGAAINGAGGALTDLLF